MHSDYTLSARIVCAPNRLTYRQMKTSARMHTEKAPDRLKFSENNHTINDINFIYSRYFCNFVYLIT